jgi:DNA polymerase-3 subunit alpha
MVRMDVGKNHDCPPILRAFDDQMPALALTDLGNLFGLVKFYSAALNKGIKPIVGADCWVSNPDEPDRPFRLLLLVKHRRGYQQLCELLTKAYICENRPEKAEILPQWFGEIGCDGLIALSGAADGDVGSALLAGNGELATERAKVWSAIFPDAFYLEVQRYGQSQQDVLVNATADLAGELSIPLVATHPIQFLDRADFRAHEARICIAEGYALGDARRPRPYTQEQYFKTQAEMAELFSDLPEALTNSVEIAKRCNIALTLGVNFLPDFPIPDGMTVSEFLLKVAQEGLEKRLLELYPEVEERERRRTEYDERLVFECNTIIQMGFPGYFLIVADFINWAKNNGVPVGPGRGSGAGSLVAYSLRITDLDPLAYALLFERFLNPERVSMPDFDIDFCQDNRWRVIEYVRQRYGADAVSQIVTFGTMSSKAVVRDVGRVLELPYSLCDRISKLIPVQANKPVSLTEALEQEPVLREMMEDERDGESIQQLFDLAQRLEDLTRNVGMHAGGVLIAPGKITDFCPIYQATGNDASPVSQFDKDDVEKAGLVKFDFLGLRNLTTIELAVEYIRRMTGEKLDLMSLGFNDPAAYQILKDANTTAIFQVESEGMKKLLKKLAPDRFEDIIAVLALYRPGPLGSGMVDDFILRKKGQQKIDYFHPDLTASLAPTYGVIVYQEQVMQISQIIGGYTLGGADMLRRAMGKKKPEEMALHRETIAAGAKEKGYDPALAEQLFDLMTKFAEYGFNKSHTAAYAVVTYQTAWLKAHHPAAFMAATLSSDMDNTDTVKIFVDDTLRNKVRLLGPDVNVSAYKFEPVDDKTIRYGLGAVKGTGEQAVNVILKTRTSEGPFKDLFDFCLRCDKRQVNRRTIEALIRAGGFDSIDADRAKLLGSVSLAMEAAEQAGRNVHQGGLFDDAPAEESHAPTYLVVDPWSSKTKLMQEKLALGFFFSGHPYDNVKAELSRCIRRSLHQLEPAKELTLLAGVVVGMRTQMTRRGKMLFLQVDDGTGMLEVSVFNELYETEKNKIVTDEVLVIEGKVSYDDFSGGNRVVADKLMTLAEVRGRFAKFLQLNLALKTPADIEVLRGLLAKFPGSTPVRLGYQNTSALCELVLGDQWRVALEDSLIDALRGWQACEGAVGSEKVKITYS